MSAMPPEAPRVDAAGLPAPWRAAIGGLGLAWAALIIAMHREWAEMVHQWWSIDTYGHILLIPPIVLWLGWLRLDELLHIAPRGWIAGLAFLAAAMALVMVGRQTGINALSHLGAVGALQAAALALLGPRAAAVLALPLGFMLFMVPLGDALIPALQMITAKMAVWLTQASGVPATIDGIHIDTPVGLFIVAEACSGVKFLIASLALGVLVCFTAFESWSRRALFMAASILVPILANGVRAWGTIFIAQSQGVAFAEGFDHIVYGWVFFGLVIALLLGGAWRWFERDPQDAGWSTAELQGSVLLARIESWSIAPGLMLWIVLGLAGLFVVLSIASGRTLG